MPCKGMPNQIPRDAEYSDLIIECQGTKFKANRVVMASASSVVATVLKQNNLQSTAIASISINNFEPEIVDKMLDFVYRGDYAYDISGVHRVRKRTAEHLETLAKLHAIGKCLKISPLCATTFDEVNDLITIGWSPDLFVPFLRSAFATEDNKELHGLAATLTAAHINELVCRFDYQQLNLPSSFISQVLNSVVNSTKRKCDALDEDLRCTKKVLGRLEKALHGRCAGSTREKKGCRRKVSFDGGDSEEEEDSENELPLKPMRSAPKRVKWEHAKSEESVKQEEFE